MSLSRFFLQLVSVAGDGSEDDFDDDDSGDAADEYDRGGRGYYGYAGGGRDVAYDSELDASGDD